MSLPPQELARPGQRRNVSAQATQAPVLSPLETVVERGPLQPGKFIITYGRVLASNVLEPTQGPYRSVMVQLIPASTDYAPSPSGHRHTARPSDGLPRFSECPECHVRPVSDAQVRCEACDATRTKARKAEQARRRRARHRDRPTTS